ncbi:MAG: hypothetical protein AB7V62_00140 [Thermoleophilia bacterium]
MAIAAHGKRCQQSPFRGSPYCWHHTQSRKIWAPSRPLGTGAARASETPSAGEAADRRLGDRRSGSDRRAGWAAEEAAARRLSDLLGPEKMGELLEFLESPADGAFLLVRDEGGLLSERSISERPARRRSA